MITTYIVNYAVRQHAKRDFHVRFEATKKQTIAHVLPTTEAKTGIMEMTTLLVSFVRIYVIQKTKNK